MRRCQKCSKPMYREDIDMGDGPQEAWHCPDRLDGTHGEWLSMPVFVTRVSDEEYQRIHESLSAWSQYRPDDLTDDELAALEELSEEVIKSKGAVII